MEDKYYTPKLEELHFGFEYEYGIAEKQEFIWKKDEFGKVFTSKSMIKRFIDNGDVRVKYLDREDIESLGFHCHANDDRVFHNKDGIILNTGWGSPVRKDEVTVVITSPVFDESKMKIIHEHYLFNGKIKNKSELKKILKMVGV